MNYRLMKQNQIVIDLKLRISLNSITVLDYKIVNYELLPLLLKLRIENNRENEYEYIQNWIDRRCVPNNRVNLDNLILDIYKVKNRSGLGRMMEYQHTAALLSYMSSGFDDYYVTPIKNEYIYHGMEDERFWTLFLLEPGNWERIERFREYPDEETDAYIKGLKEEFKTSKEFCIPNASLTIRSKWPSWWENDKIFIQKVRNNDNVEDFLKNANPLEMSVTIEEDADKDFVLMKTNYQKYCNNNIFWLNEINNDFEIEEILNKINFNEISKEFLKSNDSEAYNLGIVENEKKFELVIMK